MKKCKSCNEQSPLEAIFCENCGKEFKVQNIKKSLKNLNICPECGTDTQEKDEYCRNCRASLKNKCPNCNTNILPNSKFCSSCAYPLIEEYDKSKKIDDLPSFTSVHYKQESTLKKQKKKKYIWGILILLVIITGALIFIFNVKIIDSSIRVSCYSCDASGKKEIKETCTSCKGKGLVFCTAEKTWNYSWLGGGGSETVTCDDGHFYDPRGWGTAETCYACNGSRYHDCYTCSGYGYIKSEKNCSSCGGDGKVRKNIKITLANKWRW